MAAALFWMISLLIMLAEIAADFEYKADIENTLAEHQILLNDTGIKFLQYKDINPEATVRFKRVNIENPKGLNFFVDPSKNPLGTSSDKSKKREVKCDGRPGIKVFLLNDKKSNKKRYRYSLMGKSPQQVFCISEMRIDMLPMGDGETFMRIMVIFEDTRNKQFIGIVMNPFKPPTTKTDEAHAAKNFVQRIPPPIPLEEFSKLYLQPIRDGNKDIGQSFTENLLWMKSALNAAKFAESLYSVVKKAYTEWYYVGPVIIPEEAYDNILRLEPALQNKHTSETR